MSRFVLLLSLLWCLVEVHSQQTFPYVSFMGQPLDNHSYVDVSLVGSDNSGSYSVQCHTDVGTCCSGPQGVHRGDWYFPDGTRLKFTGSGDIYQNRRAQRVDLHRTSGSTPPGIYHCYIPSVAVHDDSDIFVRESVYIGLYPLGAGKI